MRIGIAAREFSDSEYGQFMPGTRVEYRGAVWKVIGVYFVSDGRSGGDGGVNAGGGKRAKYLVLQSLSLMGEKTRSPLGAMRPAYEYVDS